jgi:hypothetical protein
MTLFSAFASVNALDVIAPATMMVMIAARRVSQQRVARSLTQRGSGIVRERSTERRHRKITGSMRKR